MFLFGRCKTILAQTLKVIECWLMNQGWLTCGGCRNSEKVVGAPGNSVFFYIINHIFSCIMGFVIKFWSFSFPVLFKIIFVVCILNIFHQNVDTFRERIVPNIWFLIFKSTSLCKNHVILENYERCIFWWYNCNYDVLLWNTMGQYEKFSV